MEKIQTKQVPCPGCGEPMEPGKKCQNENCKYNDPAEDSWQSNKSKKS